MKKADVKKLARVLRVLVIIVFICNLIALFFVPAVVIMSPGGMVESIARDWELWASGENPGDLYYPFSVFLLLSWLGMFTEPYYAVLVLLLVLCGVGTAIILWQAKRVLDTIIKENPFTLNNARNLRRAAVCCFVISGAALVRLVSGLIYYGNISPLLTYNALFVPLFLMAGLLFMVMSALFRQAAELKEENDLTI